MKACRERAGLSVRQAAAKLQRHYRGLSNAVEAIEALEANRKGDYALLVSHLQRLKIFPFDFGRFAGLAAQTCDASIEPWAEV
jgi:hypothetical protein